MPNSSSNLAQIRREEIIAACERLYQTMGFKEITIEKIGEITPFGRTTIYHYFQTKEEIFLAILKREYESWAEELDAISAGPVLAPAELAEAIARTLADRELMLKILSMNHFDMEKNSSMEALTAFKKAYGATIRAMDEVLARHSPDLAPEDRKKILYIFFPFIHGIYPYTFVTEKQRHAMDEADVGFVYHSVYELTLKFLQTILHA